MSRKTTTVLPGQLRKALAKLGGDIRLARRRRRLTVAMMAERLAITPPTYLQIERGHPGVSVGAYAMALFTLGFGVAFADVADPMRDIQGHLLDTERLPMRVRPKKQPKAL